jgi:hemoglobin
LRSCRRGARLKPHVRHRVGQDDELLLSEGRKPEDALTTAGVDVDYNRAEEVDMQRFHLFQITALALVALVLVACGGSQQPAETARDGGATAGAERSLYERLGGKEAISAVVDDFVANVAADARINARFAKTDTAHLKLMLVDQICEATGGPCTYTGKSMREAHKGMNITETEFNALVEDLTRSLEKFNVPEREKTELLTALGGMKGDIVGV